MAKQFVDVCWTPTQSAATHVFLNGSSPYANDTIPVTEPTEFTFSASKACSDSIVYPFTMRVAPTAPDIVVKSNGGATVVLDDQYVVINEMAPLRMTLISGSKTFAIDSGKPIIRNDPHRSFNPVVLVIGALLLLALAYLIWKRTANMRVRDNTGES